MAIPFPQAREAFLIADQPLTCAFCAVSDNARVIVDREATVWQTSWAKAPSIFGLSCQEEALFCWRLLLNEILRVVERLMARQDPAAYLSVSDNAGAVDKFLVSFADGGIMSMRDRFEPDRAHKENLLASSHP